jgi:hypothetical protein
LAGSAGFITKDGFRQIEFPRDGLHLLGGQFTGVQHDGERVAGEAPVGEHVESNEGQAHDVGGGGEDNTAGNLRDHRETVNLDRWAKK